MNKLFKRWSTPAKVGLASITLLSLGVPFHPVTAHEVAIHRISHQHEPLVIESSIRISPEVITKASQAGRDAYSAVLAPFAKITPQMATKAALDRFSGARLQEINLQAFRQSLVYLALLTIGDSRYLVVVDAGNGQVLATREMMKKPHMTHGTGMMGIYR